ncbi:TPA: autotransporter outer membrane beta-barrel domain-containing protein, partial [Escherichia coli]|nr:autotransporter outer membrane beta-barrel domain-containing protein [Escherichia coli]
MMKTFKLSFLSLIVAFNCHSAALNVAKETVRDAYNISINEVYVSGTYKNSLVNLIPDVFNNDGLVTVYSGGLMDNMEVAGVGGVKVRQGGDSNGLIFNGSGAVSVYGTASDTTINTGDMHVYNGGIINDTLINTSIVNEGEANNTIVNGSFQGNGGSDTNTVVNSGASYLLLGSGNSVNLTVSKDSTALITSGMVAGATIDGAMTVNPSDSAGLEGDISVNNDGTLTVAIGSITGDANVQLNNALLNLSGTGDYTIGSMTLNGGSVVYDSQGYSTLTLDRLDGAGSFYMNTSIGELKGDFLNVTGAANGSHNVIVADTGFSPTSDSDLQLIQTGGGDAVFSLGNNGGVVDVGTYQYFLVSDANGGWKLAQAAEPEPEPTPEPAPEPTPTPEPAP